MSNPAKAKGSSAELAVKRYLISEGTQCERIPAGAKNDIADLWVPNLIWPTIDVKDHATLKLAEWVDRTAEQAHNAGRHAGIVWAKRRGKTNPADWYVITNGKQFTALMAGVK